MLCTHKTASSASLVLEICPNFANPYLTQFSSISGGNCITALSEDSRAVGRRDGKSMRVLVEQSTTPKQLWERFEPADHGDRAETGLQMALPFSVWRVRPDARTAQQLNDEPDRGSSGTPPDWECPRGVLLPQPNNRAGVEPTPGYGTSHARQRSGPSAPDGTAAESEPRVTIWESKSYGCRERR